MALKTTKKAYITNLVYGIGAAIVLIGALMKIIHKDFGSITANLMLTIGLITEAIIFLYSAFFDSPSGEYEWEKVYPELINEFNSIVKTNKNQKLEEKLVREIEMSLYSKIEEIFKKSKLDTILLEKLHSRIENFSTFVDKLSKITDSEFLTTKYRDQLTIAVNHIESLNSLYQIQLEQKKKQIELNSCLLKDLYKSVSKSQEFFNQISSLSTNLNNLNKIYKGMLNAMKV